MKYTYDNTIFIVDMNLRRSVYVYVVNFNRRLQQTFNLRLRLNAVATSVYKDYQFIIRGYCYSVDNVMS